MIHVYNSYIEDFTSKANNYPIYEGTIFENPYKWDGKTHRKKKLTFKYEKDALDAYRIYFHEMYKNNQEFKDAFDEIYDKYKKGEEIYLQCFCKPNACHGDIIVEELQKRLIQENRKK